MSISEEAVVDPAIDPDIIPPESRILVGDPIEEDEGPTEVKPEVTTLTDEERRDFAMLMTCGRRTALITVMGNHKVRIQTLKNIDEMRVGLYTKPYLGSQGFARAYQVAVCAAGIVEVDGVPLYASLRETPNPQEMFDKKIEQLEDFYPTVVSEIYNEIFKLEQGFPELVEKLGKPSG